MERAALWTLVMAAAAAPFVVDYRLFAGDFLAEFAELPQSAFVRLAAAAACASLAIGAARTGAVRRLSSPLFPPLCAALGWAGISLFWAINPGEGLPTLTHWCFCAAAGIAAAQAVRGGGDAAVLMGAVAFAGAGSALLGCLQILFPQAMAWVPQTLPPAATFGHRNAAAGFVLMSFPLCLAIWLRGRAWAAWLGSLGAAAGFFYLLFCNSRTPWLGLAAQGVAVLALRGRLRGVEWRGHRASAAAAALVAFASALLLRLSLSPVQTAPEQAREAGQTMVMPGIAGEDWDPASHEVRVNNIRARIVFWRNGLEMLRASPVGGVGLGNAKVQYPAFSRAGRVDRMIDERFELRNLHNDYLQWAVETGLVGLGLGAWLFVALWASYRRLLAAPDELARALAIGVGVGFAGFAADAAVNFPMERALPPFYLALFAGAATALSRGEGEMMPLARWRGPAAALGGVLLVLGAFVNGCRRLAGEVHLTRAQVGASRGEWRQVQAEAAKARWLNPGRLDALFFSGLALLKEGRPAEAVAALEPLAAAYPYTMNYLALLGRAYAADGKRREAEAAYSRALEIKPDYARAHYFRGLLYADAGYSKEALIHLRRAAGFEPDSAVFQAALGEAALIQGEREEARLAFGRALSLKPGSEEAARRIKERLAELDPAKPGETGKNK